MGQKIGEERELEKSLKKQKTPQVLAVHTAMPSLGSLQLERTSGCLRTF